MKRTTTVVTKSFRSVGTKVLDQMPEKHKNTLMNMNMGKLVPDSEGEAMKSGACDIIVVRQSISAEMLSIPMHVMIGKLTSLNSLRKTREGRDIRITINNIVSHTSMVVKDSGAGEFRRSGRHAKSFTSFEWEQFNLTPGSNRGTYKVPSLSVEIPFRVFLLSQSNQLVLTDVDGTITLSDFEGIVMPIFGNHAEHDGVVELFARKAQAGMTVVYLSARPMSEDKPTKDYLFKKLQNKNGHSLPLGPVLLCPRIMTLAAMEGLLIPQKQKSESIRDILELFSVGPGCIYRAYGNRSSDTKAYLGAGLDQDKIWIVKRDGELKNSALETSSSYAVEARGMAHAASWS